MLLVVNQGDRNVSVIDPVAGQQTARVAESGVTGHEVAVYPPRHIAFVPIYGNSGVGKPGTDGQVIDVIDLKTLKQVGSVDFGRGVRPHCAVYDPVSGMMYVTTELEKSVSIIDPNTLKVVGSIPTSQEQSHMLAISHDGRFGYTANVGPGTVSVLDLKARKTTAVIPISANTQRISISNDDSMVFTADQKSPRLAVIDTATNRVKTWIDLPAVAYGTAPTKDGRWLIVTMPSVNKVAVVDLKTLKVARTVDVAAKPVEVLVGPDGLVAYVSCSDANEIAAIDLKTWTVEKTMKAGAYSDGMAWGQ
jgi:DNA-binding beta-propeller fold protein YncE